MIFEQISNKIISKQLPKVWILKANFYDLRKAVVTERNDAQKAIFSTLEQKLQISNAFKNLLHLEFYLKKSFKTDVCYCREKFAINFSGSRALFILNLGCYFHFLKVKKNCQFSMILHLQDIHFGFIGLQNIKNWPEVVKSTVCIVWSCFFFFTKVRMSRLLLWREHNIPKNCQESCHMNYFFLWSRTHIFLF